MSTGDFASLYVLEQPDGLRIEVTPVGASWVSCQVPQTDGTRREVLLGYARLDEYFGGRAYLGATVGRYANRIAGARYLQDGSEIRLVANEGHNQLHGGPDAFDRRTWEVVHVGPRSLVLALHSPDGDQGFPGAVDVQVSYVLDTDFSVRIEFAATVTQRTPLALTNHALFNLDAKHVDCRTHQLRIAGAQYVPVDAKRIPLGTLDPVPADFDFRVAHPIERDFLASEQQQMAGGYDHAWLLDEACRSGAEAAAEIFSSDGRLRASLFTDQPALQFYSGNVLDGVSRRGGGAYTRHTGLALEPGFPPDSPNHPEWGAWSDCFAKPGVPWRAFMRWVFTPG